MRFGKTADDGREGTGLVGQFDHQDLRLEHRQVESGKDLPHPLRIIAHQAQHAVLLEIDDGQCRQVNLGVGHGADHLGQNAWLIDQEDAGLGGCLHCSIPRLMMPMILRHCRECIGN